MNIMPRMRRSRNSGLTRQWFIFSLVLILLVILVFSLSFSRTSRPRRDPGGIRYGGTLVWGTTNTPTVINPVLTSYSVSSSLMGLIFDPLVRIDGRGRIVPGLAETWEISEDGTEYTFHLRRGVRFHDGTECTAADVKFTYDAMTDPANRSPWRTAPASAGMFDALDRYTLRVKLPHPSFDFLRNLTREIAPRHLLNGRDFAADDFNYHPVGTGPFRLQKWERETNEIELAANPDYYEGRPYLDKIIVRTFSDNTSLWAALMRGEIDFVKFINKDDYLVVKDTPGFRAYQIPQDTYWAMVYNLKDSELYDVEIRRAIARAINLDELMAAVSSGGIASSGPLSPHSPGFNPGVERLSYDPIRARMDLMHHGWRDEDGDGILERFGKELELGLLVDYKSEYYKRMALIIRQQLYEIGVRVRIIPYLDEKELTEEFLAEHKPKAWLRFFWGFSDNPFNPLVNWHSATSRPFEFWEYKNEAVDKLLESGRMTTDREEQLDISREIHRIIYEEQPACFLFFPVSYHAVSVKFNNTDNFFTPYMPGHTLKDWYFEKSPDLL